MQDNQVACRRCGFVWTVNAEKRGRKDLLCISCRQKPATTIQYGKLRCTPHQGRLNFISTLLLMLYADPVVMRGRDEATDVDAMDGFIWGDSLQMY